MSVKLQVPEEHAEALAEFLKLPPQTLSSFSKVLRDAQPTLEISELISKVADHLSLERRQVREFFSLLASLYALREDLGVDMPEFIAELREAVEDNGTIDITSDWDTFESVLSEALSGDTALSVSAKAISVLTDHLHTFWHARVLTDLRPVFSASLSAPIPAMVVVHNLKVAYREAGERREFFVALDSLDVADLIELLGRAQEKEKSLRALAEQKGLTILEVNS